MANQDAEKNKTTRRSREEQTDAGQFEVSRPAARPRRNPRPDTTQGEFEVSRPAARSRARGEKSANAVLDRTGNRYHVNREREAREEEQDEKMREHIRRREEIEEAASLFTRKTEATGYPYWLSLLVTTFKLFLICVLIIGFSGVGFVLGMAKSYLDTVPELDFSVVQEQDQSTLLYDVNGQFLGNYYNSENRDWATLDEIPDELENAVIAIEDSRFRRHMGIDPKRIFGVLLSNLFSGSQQGGSTITQQLIKNTILSFEQTYKRKIQEAALALEMERKYSKDQILEAYLNTIYMGGSCYGVKTAAMDYFGKNVNELSLRECACLAGMIQNPSRYNPRTNYYTRSNPARTDNRTNLVLYEMRRNGLVTQEEYDAARQDTLSVQEKSPYTAQKEMVYFTDYVIDSIVDEILSDRGMENNAANRTRIRKEIRTEGYRIYTTMDADKQRAAEEAVYAYDN
ncbi:MAG: transglycosylase domain-containing protein, partial [Clostridia bacterium]|nr:transglycosylase domain-containing protein [Clostridia bacterium]